MVFPALSLTTNPVVQNTPLRRLTTLMDWRKSNGVLDEDEQAPQLHDLVVVGHVHGMRGPEGHAPRHQLHVMTTLVVVGPLLREIEDNCSDRHSGVRRQSS